MFNLKRSILCLSVALVPISAIASQYVIRAPIDLKMAEWQPLPKSFGLWNDVGGLYGALIGHLRSIVLIMV